VVLIGTSGWVYRHWRDLLYPHDLPGKDWLPYFAERFPTVELNNSFYRLPTEQMFERWREDSPAGFLFAVKASRFITHLKRLRDPAEPLALMWSRVVKLGDKLGPVLFQMPPRFPADPPRLAAFLEQLPDGMRAALEFRDRSWETDEVFEMLDRAGAAFVYADWPGVRVPNVVTAGWAYIRFHKGRSDGPAYPRAKLSRWADRIATLDARDIYIYFNNDTEGAALEDAETLRVMLEQRGIRLQRPGDPLPAAAGGAPRVRRR
jgi:uncharacterized protein YecE (DUF72 family)